MSPDWRREGPESGDGLAGGFPFVLDAGFGIEQQGSIHLEIVHQLTPIAAAIFIRMACSNLGDPAVRSPSLPVL